VVKDLVAAGHKVLGLARSDAGAEAVRKAGGEVHRGSLEDLESLKSGVATTDGVIHLAFNHDFTKFADNCEAETRAVKTLGESLAGSDRPFVVTSGLGFLAQGRPGTEEDNPIPNPAYPRTSEATAVSFLPDKVNVSIVRLPQVHDQHKQGLITYLIAIAQQKGVSAYIGEGKTRWSAVHKLDAAQLYRLAFEKKRAGAKYHAVAEEGVTFKQIAEAIGHRLNLPVVSKSEEETAEHFGWMAMFANLDLVGSSAITKKELNWHPTGPHLISDLQNLKIVENAVH
jgi:nucleoside-diphosphate-sugar epimerase